MKFLFYVLISLFLFSCKEEKTFADDIVLSFPKDEKMSFQKFNEGVGESGTGIIYIGKHTSKIDVKYFKSMIPPPPAPPGYKIDSSVINTQQTMSQYFHDSFKRMKYSKKPVLFDSLSKNNVKLIVKIQDTIPKYAYNYNTQTIKKYKAFPVFIKNISGRKLYLSEFKNFPLAFQNDKNKWQTIWNENSLGGCYSSWENFYYWELKPNEIMVVSINYLTGKKTGNFKIWTGNFLSDKFSMNYNKQIIKDQRFVYEVK